MSILSRRALVAAAAGLALSGVASGAARAQDFINILTGGTSGVYYPLGVAISKVVTENVKGARPSVQATRASVENLLLLQSGKGEIAFTLGDSLASAWQGDAEAGFKTKLDKLRGIAAVYPNFVQIVATKESGIKTLADLKGKRISVGAPRSGTELNARTLLNAAGISYKDLGKVEYLPFGESVDLMKNRQLDATLQSAGLGVASIRDLANSVPIVLVAIPESVVQKVGAPYASKVIPKGTYVGQDADVTTAGVINFLATRADLSETAVYNITMAIFENLGDLRAAHSAAKEIDLKTALANMPVPPHPGAAKYFKEKGVLK